MVEFQAKSKTTIFTLCRPQEEHAADRQLSLLADLKPHAAPPAVGRILTKRPVTAGEAAMICDYAADVAFVEGP